MARMSDNAAKTRSNARESASTICYDTYQDGETSQTAQSTQDHTFASSNKGHEVHELRMAGVALTIQEAHLEQQEAPPR
eukprot:6488651-Amphidinium_carterae.2